MQGTGFATAAITIVNALATGIGAAVAVDLPVRAAVEVTPVQGKGAGELEFEPGSDSPIVRASLLAALRTYFPSAEVKVRTHVRSDIPRSRGLKSSSAVGSAVVAAVANAAQQQPSPENVAGLVAEVARSIGQSATGAFDDALACARGGLVVTDNVNLATIRTDELDAGWQAVLWIPRGEHAPSPEWAGRFRDVANEARSAADAARAGAYLVAMNRNTELVERVIGYDYRALREELRRKGAIGSGVSGLGPTLAAIADAKSLAAVRRALPRGTAQVLTTGFRAPLADGVRPEP